LITFKSYQEALDGWSVHPNRRPAKYRRADRQPAGPLAAPVRPWCKLPPWPERYSPATSAPLPAATPARAAGRSPNSTC
jgi:hypothetical protein